MEPLQPGDPQRVGAYRLIGRLGAGGMGRVYLARSPGGRTVAVKVVRPELAQDPDFRRRFRQEVEVARVVPGRYTAPVVDADPEAPPPELPWLATQYVTGPSLSDVIRRHGALPEKTVRALGAGLAEALGEIHAAGLVHRDLKPSNVLMAADGPRVIDFGIARAVDGDRMTRTGSLVGSPGFMSPEQATGGDVGPAADVFSLGTVLAYAATGQNAFGDSSPAALLYQVAHAEPELDGLPESLRALVEACLAKDPAARPAPATIAAHCEPGGVDHAFADWLPGAVASTIATHASRILDYDLPDGDDGSTAGPSEAAASPGADSERTMMLRTPPPGAGTPSYGPPPSPGTPPPGPGTPPPVPGKPQGAPQQTSYGSYGSHDSYGSHGSYAPPTPASGTGWGPDGGPDTQQTPERERPASRRRFLGVAAGAVGVAAVGGGAAWMLTRDDGDDQAAGTTGGGDKPEKKPDSGQFTTPPAGVAPQPLWLVPMEDGSITSTDPVVVGDIAAVSGRPLRSVNVRTGKVDWKREEIGQPAVRDFVRDGETVYFGGGRYDGALVGINIKTGKESWRTRISEELRAEKIVGTDGDRLYLFADVDDGELFNTDKDSVWCAVDLKTRKQSWRVPRDKKVSGYNMRAAVGGGYLVTCEVNSVLTSRDVTDGKELWNRKLDDGVQPVLVDDQVIVSGEELVAYHAKTGKRLWSLDPNGRRAFGTPVFLDGALYVFDFDQGLWKVDPKSGKRIDMREELGGRARGESMVKVGDSIYIASGPLGSGITAIDAKTMKHRWTYTESDRSGAWSIAAAGDRLIVLHNKRLLALPAV